jgi:hypothetical protein
MQVPSTHNNRAHITNNSRKDSNWIRKISREGKSCRCHWHFIPSVHDQSIECESIGIYKEVVDLNKELHCCYFRVNIKENLDFSFLYRPLASLRRYTHIYTRWNFHSEGIKQTKTNWVKMQMNVAGLRRNIKNLAHNYSDAQVSEPQSVFINTHLYDDWRTTMIMAITQVLTLFLDLFLGEGSRGDV